MRYALLLLALVFSSVALAQAPTPCDNLSTLALDDTTITSAGLVAAAADGVPASCRVAAILRPSPDSVIKIEVWMPASLSGWNGKFQATGNGGWSGAINPGALSAALRRGYATAGTDTGHSGGSGAFALGHPEKLIDFGWRAVHEMTVKSKAIIAAYYGRPAKYSYWVGCSSGGKQGLKEAQRFPADYDGIVAGAPANYWTHLVTASLWTAQATLIDPASFIPPHKYGVLRKAVIDSCDPENPGRCNFDPATVQCKEADAPTCLTAPQVEAARKIYAGPRNPQTGASIFPGLAPTSESGWAAMAGGPKPLSIADDYFKYVVFKNATWDFKTLNFDADVALADKIDAAGGQLNAIDPDISKFTAHNGKLILYHGWSDQLIAPQNSINYYTQVAGALGAKSLDSVRLFMVPGMAHCGGGDGANQFDMLTPLERWVEKDIAPDRVLAARRAGGSVGDVVRTHPLCAYPLVAQYKGSGDKDDAANFVCGVEAKQ